MMKLSRISNRNHVYNQTFIYKVGKLNQNAKHTQKESSILFPEKAFLNYLFYILLEFQKCALLFLGIDASRWIIVLLFNTRVHHI